jgi:hypothetical protein
MKQHANSTTSTNFDNILQKVLDKSDRDVEVVRPTELHEDDQTTR